MLNFSRNFLLGCFLLVACAVRGQQTKEQFNFSIKYLLSFPDGYDADTTKVWPLLIFLHGSGESGEDLEKVKKNGPPKLIEAGKKFPFIVVSPQSANFGWQPELMEQFLRGLKKNLRVDKNRIYLTGLSMGGFGTWNWATKYPRNFAAIAPICGGGDTAEAWKLKNIPVWCFHGGKDLVVPARLSMEMMDAVKKVNPDARLTIYPEAGHDSWTETYNNDSLYAWLLQQKRKELKRVVVAAETLNVYSGSYLQHRHDTLLLMISEGKLLVKTGDGNVELVPAGKDLFFLQQGDDQLEIKFFRNRKGAIEKFVFYDDRPIEFKKLKT